MSENTLKIRINIQQSPQQAIEEIYPDLNEPEIEYEQSWDWKKIALAIVLLLAMVVAIGAILFGTTKIESSATKQESTATTIDQANVLHEKQAIPQQQASEHAIAATPPSASDSSLSSAIIQSGDAIQSETGAHSSSPITVPFTKPKPEPKIQKSIVIPRQKPAIKSQPKPQETSDYPQVIRAQLSHAIKAREPIDDIDTVQLQQGESKPIYFYLHLKGLQKKKITVLWYRNGKLDSQLPLQIHTNNWRTHASKQLDHARLGAWHVELADESGNRLASRHFTVTQY